MNARATQETVMSDEGRIGMLESDVRHLQADVTEIKGEVNALRGAVDLLRIEFLTFKTEVAKEFGLVRISIEALRTEIERAKLWMVVTGVGTILSVWGAAFALARFLKP